MATRSKSNWIDVTVPVKTGMVHWPGDPAVQITRAKDIARGDSSTVSLLEFGAHTGTHMDAPAHFISGGASIDTMPLEATMGPARVIAVRDSVSIKRAHLETARIRAGERILFKTANSTRCWTSDRFVEDFVYITPEAAAYLAERRVRMVGVDYLSVGGFKKDGRETHLNLLEAGVWIVEGLNLSKVKPGPVEFVCLPLRLAGADGAPARAFVKQSPRAGARE